MKKIYPKNQIKFVIVTIFLLGFFVEFKVFRILSMNEIGFCTKLETVQKQ